MKRKLVFFYKFFRSYGNPAWLALMKARAILMNKKVHPYPHYAL